MPPYRLNVPFGVGSFAVGTDHPYSNRLVFVTRCDHVDPYSLALSLPVSRARLRLRYALLTGAFNTPNFGFPNAAIGSPSAGRITSIINDNRDLQLALRLEF